VRTLAHRLHGSGACYGLPQVSEAGHAAEVADAAALPEALAHLLAVLGEAGVSPE